jgi:hypothetical protein
MSSQSSTKSKLFKAGVTAAIGLSLVLSGCNGMQMPGPTTGQTPTDGKTPTTQSGGEQGKKTNVFQYLGNKIVNSDFGKAVGKAKDDFVKSVEKTGTDIANGYEAVVDMLQGGDQVSQAEVDALKAKRTQVSPDGITSKLSTKRLTKGGR